MVLSKEYVVGDLAEFGNFDNQDLKDELHPILQLWLVQSKGFEYLPLEDF